MVPALQCPLMHMLADPHAAPFQVSYQPNKKWFKEVPFLQRFETQYRSIQASLSEEEG